MNIRFFVELKCQSTITLSINIKYSMPKPICEVNYCAVPHR